MSQTKFKEYCEKGDFIKAKEIYEKKPFVIKYPHIREAFQHGHIDLFNWILSINKDLIKKITPADIESMIENCLIDVIKYMMTIIHIRFEYNNFCYLNNAFGKNSSQEKMLFIYEQSKTLLNQCKKQNEVWEHCFKSACTHGNIDFAKWIVKNQVMDLNKIKDSVFHWSGYFDNIDVMNYLWELTNGTINLYYRNEIFEITLFDNACTQGKYNVVKWLLDHDVVDINNNGFEQACMFNRIDIVELLWNDSISITKSLIDFLIHYHCVKPMQFLINKNVIEKPLHCDINNISAEMYTLLSDNGYITKRVKI